MREQLPFIQTLRAVAAMLVLFDHSPNHLWFFKLGYSGVDCFFILSGFIMVVSTADQTGAKAFKLFVINRFARIWPVYAVTSAVMAVAFCFIGTVSSQEALTRLVHDLTFQPAWNSPPINAPGWSLTFEIVFYTLFAVSLLFGRWRYPILLGTMGTMLLFSGQSARIDGLWGYVALATNPICGCFVVGVLCGLIYRAKWRGIPYSIAVCLLATFSIFTTYLLFFSLREFNHGFMWATAYGGIVLSLTLMEKHSPVWVPISLVRMGNASFSIYISQWLVIIPFLKYAPQAADSTQLLTLGGVFLLMVAAVSFLTYRLLEKGLSQWAREQLQRIFLTPGRQPDEASPSIVPAQ
ncbi:acyltransferase [Mesorhizobium sp. M1004]|uniref:acyltransferase family protein n=1 Tax=Mesorhizobium sp. M1004 TaxID=2957046 RepID=UPI00333AE3C8